MSFEGVDPVDLSTLQVLKQQPYMVGPKMDGVRLLMYHDENTEGEKTFFISRKGEKIPYQSENITYQPALYSSEHEKLVPHGPPKVRRKKCMPCTTIKKYVIDVEKMEDNTYFILDILQVNDMNLRWNTFDFRYQLLQRLFCEDVIQTTSPREDCDLNRFFVLEYILWYPKLTLGEIVKNYSPIDGVIFVAKNQPYKAERYRYKFLDTIDFQADASGNLNVLVGRGPFERVEPFIMWRQRSASVREYVQAGGIYECAFNIKKQTWRVVKKREDKEKPNRLHVARYIFFNVILKKKYLHPFQ